MESSRMSTGRASMMSPKSMVATEAVELQAQQFMDEWHLRIVSSTLGRTMSQEEATRRALECFATKEDVEIDEAELEEMVGYPDESYLVSDLVEKLPPEIREDFDGTSENFLENLSLTAQVRRVLDNEGSAEDIQQVVEATDCTPMGQAILKEAVISASKEVEQIYHNQDTWVKSMGKRLDRLQRSAEFAEHAQQQLHAVETQLEQFADEQSTKSKNALINMAHDNEKSLMASVFVNWNGICQFGRGERVIIRRYEAEVARCEKALFDYKEKRIANVRKVLLRNARDTDEGLCRSVVQTWHTFTDDRKRTGSTKERMLELEGQLKTMSDRAAHNTHKVLARLGEESDDKWLGIAFGAWMKYHEDYSKNKELEDAVKKAEHSFKEVMDKKKGDTKRLIQNMHGSTENGLINMCWQAWEHLSSESARLRRLEAKMQANGGAFKSLSDKTRNNAVNVQGRVNDQVRMNLCLRCLSVWVLESKVNHVEKYYEKKVNHKRQQLSSVQTLFKSFAKQLEEGLSNLDGESSGRTATRKMKGMNKGEGSVSLPDIHARQGVPA